MVVVAVAVSNSCTAHLHVSATEDGDCRMVVSEAVQRLVRSCSGLPWTRAACRRSDAAAGGRSRDVA